MSTKRKKIISTLLQLYQTDFLRRPCKLLFISIFTGQKGSNFVTKKNFECSYMKVQASKLEYKTVS